MKFKSKATGKVYDFTPEEWEDQLNKNGGQFFIPLTEGESKDATIVRHNDPMIARPRVTDEDAEPKTDYPLINESKKSHKITTPPVDAKTVEPVPPPKITPQPINPEGGSWEKAISGEPSIPQKPLEEMDSEELINLLDIKGVQYDRRIKSKQKLIAILNGQG